MKRMQEQMKEIEDEDWSVMNVEGYGVDDGISNQIEIEWMKIEPRNSIKIHKINNIINLIFLFSFSVHLQFYKLFVFLELNCIVVGLGELTGEREDRSLIERK